MSAPRRMLRYYDCLTAIKPPSTANKFMLEAGWKNHKEIEERYPPAFKVDRQLFTSPELDFDIGYHPDMYDAATSTVYETKSLAYYVEQERYCLVQLSGYMHFLQ